MDNGCRELVEIGVLAESFLMPEAWRQRQSFPSMITAI